MALLPSFCMLLAGSGAILTSTAHAAAPLKGTVFEIGTRKALYLLELQDPGRDKPTRRVNAEYRTLAGKPVLREEAVYTDGVLTEYSIRQLQSGEKARVVLHDGKINFFKRKGEEESAASEDLVADTLIDDQIAEFASKRWTDLTAGKTLKFRFVVPLRQETIGFELSKEKDGEWKTPGTKTLVALMRPQSFFLRFFVDPIYLTFEAKAPHRLLGVQGRTALKAENDPDGSDIDAALEFER